jgi:hypothetical protein
MSVFVGGPDEDVSSALSPKRGLSLMGPQVQEPMLHLGAGQVGDFDRAFFLSPHDQPGCLTVDGYVSL